MKIEQIHITSLAVTIALLALLVAIKNYRRKTGILIRGSHGICDSIYCEDPYISNIILENLKDRAVTIFAIYLRVDHGYYIEIENFEEKPLILKPYETFHKEYGPIELYYVNSNKVLMRNLLKDEKIQKKLVLSTSEGKYLIPSFVKRWNPIGEALTSHHSAVIRPVRITYKNTDAGSNAIYLVEFISEKGKEEIVPIHPQDYQVKRFRNFNLTKESLSSKQSLIDLITQEISKGTVSCKSFEVHDLSEWRVRHRELFKREFEPTKVNRFRFFFFGYIPYKYAYLSISIRRAMKRFF